MHYRFAIEEIEPHHWIAWALDMPGCFSSAKSEHEALAGAPGAVSAYFTWVAAHDPSLPMPDGPVDLEIVERFRAFPSSSDPEYLVNAFFEDDRRPLGYWEVVAGLRLLEWSRSNLLGILEQIAHSDLNQPLAGRGSRLLGDILDHIARAENWYLGRLGLGLGWHSLPADPLARLGMVRAHMRERLIDLIGDERVIEATEERWSARKLLRRTLWHERDHTQEIAQIIAGIGPAA